MTRQAGHELKIGAKGSHCRNSIDDFGDDTKSAMIIANRSGKPSPLNATRGKIRFNDGAIKAPEEKRPFGEVSRALLLIYTVGRTPSPRSVSRLIRI